MENGAGSTALAPEKPRFDPASPAHRAFEAAARAAGMEPASPWIGGYADYEWTHLRPLLQAYQLAPAAKDVLEFGCNAGGSSVVLAALRARLTGVDVDAGAVRVAAANLERHGLGGSAHILHVLDTRHMPFAAGSFDFILANSVLEYVAPDQLDAVMAELHRLLRRWGDADMRDRQPAGSPGNSFPALAGQLSASLGRQADRETAAKRVKPALAGKSHSRTVRRCDRPLLAGGTAGDPWRTVPVHAASGRSRPADRPQSGLGRSPYRGAAA